MPFTSATSCQGITLKWGTTEIGVTSMQYSGSAATEVDITGMNAKVVTDPNNTQRKLVRKSIDYATIELGELSCEYFGPGDFNSDLLGSKRLLSLAGNTSMAWSTQAFLATISTQVAAGDLVKGSCTFRLSDL